VLALANNAIGGHGAVAALASRLEGAHLPHLEGLFLDHNELTAADGEALASAVSTRSVVPKLSHLDVRWQAGGGVGAEAGAALRHAACETERTTGKYEAKLVVLV
jgi:hypothetical protein